MRPPALPAPAFGDARVTHPVLPRRRALGLGAGMLALPGLAHAEIRGQIVVGKEGWLFGLWEDVRRVNLQRSRAAGAFVNAAVGEFRRAGIELVLTIAPGRYRTYEEMLPPEFQMNPDAKQRYGVLLTEFRRSGALVPDLAAAFARHKQAAQADLLFFKYDTHWTGTGAETAATEVAKAVKERLRLPPSQKHGT